MWKYFITNLNGGIEVNLDKSVKISVFSLKIKFVYRFILEMLQVDLRKIIDQKIIVMLISMKLIII